MEALPFSTSRWSTGVGPGIHIPLVYSTMSLCLSSLLAYAQELWSFCLHWLWMPRYGNLCLVLFFVSLGLWDFHSLLHSLLHLARLCNYWGSSQIVFIWIYDELHFGHLFSICSLSLNNWVFKRTDEYMLVIRTVLQTFYGLVRCCWRPHDTDCPEFTYASMWTESCRFSTLPFAGTARQDKI